MMDLGDRYKKSEYSTHYTDYTDYTCPLQSMFIVCTGTHWGQPCRASRLSLGNAIEEATLCKAPSLRHVGSNRVIRVTKQNVLEPVCNEILDQFYLPYHHNFINISDVLQTFLPVTMPVASTVRVESMFSIPVLSAVSQSVVHLNDFEMRMMFPYYRVTDFITLISYRSIRE